MGNSFDIKSGVIGGLLVLVVVFCIGAAVHVPAQACIDRFKVEASNEYALVLDSATGQTWVWTVRYANNVDNEDVAAFLGPKAQ